ncbi:MAG: nitroreductase family protein [Acidimicrobiaceae bacterium]|nr:nitroreductase family protein [Acidimicrobiaceae bacterium]MYG99813.1 nitroreductase family protein [Acidimicrobiaceae bacterium]MYL04510.1 nitroreductase family protein [Acidimicrobiaceae bacterium]
MEFEHAVRRRRMVRSFTSETVPPLTVDEICDLARRAPTAGNTAGVEFLVLEGSDTAAYWDVTLPLEQRDGFAWPGLLNAPVLVVVWSHPGGYLRRYREPDKDHTGLGAGEEAWPVPYWFVDGGAAVMTLLLAAQDRGLGAAFFGMFDHEQDVRQRFGVPPDRRGVGTVAIGHPADDDRPSRSARRGRPPLDEVLHRSGW